MKAPLQPQLNKLGQATLQPVPISLRKTRPVAESRSGQKLRTLVKTLAVGTAGFASALLVWEGTLQLAVEANQGIADHPALGKIDNPGKLIHTREGFNRTQLNSLGMRAPEPTPKQPGEYRILMLGDSFTRADEVSDGISFSDRLQAHFSSTTENPAQPDSAAPINLPQRLITEQVQVINAGKPSASPAGYLHAADFHNQTFAPDTTVIQLTESDFTMDMSSEYSEFYLERSEGEAYQTRQNETFGSADPLAQKVMSKAPWLDNLLQSSVLRIGGRNLSSALSGANPHSEDAEALTPKKEQRLQAEDAAMVRWSIQQLKQQFPNIVIVFIPAMNYQDAGTTSSVPRNAAIEAALTEATAEQGVPLLNMRQDFLTHYRTQGTQLKGFNNTLPGEGHLNPTGHQIVAQRLIDFYAQPDSPLKSN